MADSADRRAGVLSVALILVVAILLVLTAVLAGHHRSSGGATPLADERLVIPQNFTLAPSSASPSERLPAARVDQDDWVRRTASRTGIGDPALRAYASAVRRLRDEQPRCRLGWTTLAGIGWVESGHGGQQLGADAKTRTAILGPPIFDGRQHARGPMQFIDSTWRRWGSDGDGDGLADVDDLDDAALAAARYLCASGDDLSDGRAWSRAVYSYNHSNDYVRSVLRAANVYAGAASR